MAPGEYPSVNVTRLPQPGLHRNLWRILEDSSASNAFNGGHLQWTSPLQPSSVGSASLSCTNEFVTSVLAGGGSIWRKKRLLPCGVPHSEQRFDQAGSVRLA
jgi:hypothetical protein